MPIKGYCMRDFNITSYIHLYADLVFIAEYPQTPTAPPQKTAAAKNALSIGNIFAIAVAFIYHCRLMWVPYVRTYKNKPLFTNIYI